MHTMIFKKKAAEEGNLKKGEKLPRISTGVNDLDKLLFGGIPEGASVLLSGEPGTMKTTLAFHALFYNAKQGKKCVMVTLEERSKNILRQMLSMGYDLESIKIQIIPDLGDSPVRSRQNADLTIIDIGHFRDYIDTKKKKTKKKDAPEEQDWIGLMKTVMEDIKKEFDFDVFALDSLSALYSLSDIQNLRRDLFHMFGYFENLNMTSFFVSEIAPTGGQYSEFGIEEYMADGIISLRKEERELKVLGKLNVVKMRGTQINSDIFIYEYEKNNFKLYQKLD